MKQPTANFCAGVLQPTTSVCPSSSTAAEQEHTAPAPCTSPMAAAAAPTVSGFANLGMFAFIVAIGSISAVAAADCVLF
jgi:hypothetical protein